MIPLGFSLFIFLKHDIQSIESVALWQFVIATLFIYPKLLLHVFIGSLAAPLSDGEQRGHMDTSKLADMVQCFLPI